MLMPITRIAKQIRAKNMNILSWSAEAWRSVFEFASIAGAVIALISGAISVGSLIGIAVTDRIIKRHQASEDHQRAVRLLTLEKETAEAQRKLLETENRLAWRKLTGNFPKKGDLEPGSSWFALVLYKKGDEEAYEFAKNIRAVLRGAGWEIDDEPDPIDNDWTIESAAYPGIPKIRPGIKIILPGLSRDSKRVEVLVEGFTASGFPPTIFGDDRLTRVTIIVGPRLL
jgi:hypothetical protein